MQKPRVSHEKLRIIDTIGPFFSITDTSATINWSKVPFARLEENNRLSTATCDGIVQRFTHYIRRVAELGYNSISIDDLAHMTQFSFYKNDLQILLSDYHNLYRKLFAAARQYNMQIFVTTDYLFFNDAITAHLQQTKISTSEFYVSALESVLDTFPEIDGVILRVGEKDGNDVNDRFLSQLLLRTPKQANQLLADILPLFERRSKLLIFRTWTIGAYTIGDLIWNEKTYDAVFASIKSDALVISMKYGDTDFMRYLELNPLFQKTGHKKIIELQTRREWEGMGTYPSFIGKDYAAFFKQLADNPTVIGIHVWCQTGGWAKAAWANITYLERSSFWNELNTEVTLSLAQGASLNYAIDTFCERRSISDTEAFKQLLLLADTAVKKGIYVAQLAASEFYFRRSRIPPLMWITWDKIHLPAAVIHLHRILITDPIVFIQDADEAVQATQTMLTLAKQLQLNQTVLDSLEFEFATLQIFSGLR